ncbi:protein-glutamate methylesterase/protein-glutamine glutaminase [Vibrio sp.]|uniref:protein-glutamate methylesterase/protein-glutamine glutaminase n=1 Tax=Vibrio sp. TaxID=678 RepID=UPI003D10CEA9
MSQKVKVMVVDDSPVYRALLTEIINSDPMLQVVATAEDPYQARELIKRHSPDVLTLDVEMPKMSGVQFLKNLMRLRPMPVVMISTLTQHGAEATLAALELGAVDYFPKPTMENPAELVNYKRQVNEKIRIAAGANVQADSGVKMELLQPPASSRGQSHCQLIAIGASTGGTEAVKQVISALPAAMPPIIITQHISAMFTPSFAQRLNESSAIEVKELTAAKAPLINGCAYLAPGNKHIVVEKQGPRLYVALDDRPPVNRHKPSVDVMFDAVAESVGSRAMAVLLTGMGQDGAKGMLKMKQNGAMTLVQDEKSSVVWGMPRVAYELGAAQQVADLKDIARQIYQHVYPNMRLS